MLPVSRQLQNELNSKFIEMKGYLICGNRNIGYLAGDHKGTTISRHATHADMWRMPHGASEPSLHVGPIFGEKVGEAVCLNHCKKS